MDIADYFSTKALKQKDGIDFYMPSDIGYEDVEKKVSDFDEISAQMEKRNWRDIVKEKYEKTNNWLYKVITDIRRADYLNFVDIKKDWVALDAGAGWGQSTFTLADRLSHVFALDGSFFKARFIKERAQQEKVNNITPLVADVLRMPFKGSSFDLVTMVGVLEYTGEFETKGDPRQIQISALKEIKRVLKKDGMLCLAIENSHGHRYKVGEPDDHTGIKHITYKSRKEANEMSQAARGRDYRTYTYNMEGYMKLFKAAGFSDLKFYYPIPDYRIYQAFISLDDLDLLKFIYKELPLEDLPWYMGEVVNYELEMIKKGFYEELKNTVSSYFIFAK